MKVLRAAFPPLIPFVAITRDGVLVAGLLRSYAPAPSAVFLAIWETGRAGAGDAEDLGQRACRLRLSTFHRHRPRVALSSSRWCRRRFIPTCVFQTVR